MTSLRRPLVIDSAASLQETITPLIHASLLYAKKRLLFNIFLIWIRVDFLPGREMCKKWLIFCSQSATRLPLARIGPQTSSTVVQRFNQIQSQVRLQEGLIRRSSDYWRLVSSCT